MERVLSSFGSALLGAAVGCGLLLGLHDPLDSPPATDPSTALGLDAALRRLDALERRPLAAAVAPAAPMLVERAAVESTAIEPTAEAATDDESLRAVVWQLRQDVADLRERIAAQGFEVDPDASPAERREQIDDALGAIFTGTDPADSMARIQLRLQLFELGLGPEEARDHLRRLAEDYERSGQPHRALTTIDRFGPRLGVPELELDRLRLAFARRPDHRVEIARRLIAAPGDAEDRDQAVCELARSLAQCGREAEALRTIDALLARSEGLHEESVRTAEWIRERITRGEFRRD